MEKNGCGCKKNGRGHNFIPERITLKGEGGEITNRDLVCHHCAFKKRGDTLSCLRFKKKPGGVLAGGECEAFLSTGEELGGSRSAGCGDCKSCHEHGACREHGNEHEENCEGCDGICTGCGACGKE